MLNFLIQITMVKKIMLIKIIANYDPIKVVITYVLVRYKDLQHFLFGVYDEKFNLE